MIEWWVLGICITLYTAGLIHGVSLAHWSHRKEEE